MGDFGAVRSRLNRAGWDEVALAGIADLPWHEVSGILRSAVGDLSFADELQIRALVSEATRKEDMSNRPFALQPVAFHKGGGWSRRYLHMCSCRIILYMTPFVQVGALN